MLKTKKSRSSLESELPAETFSSLEVSRITSVSLRQLQWWDEQGVVSPVQRGHKRMYQMHEVVEIAMITELRRKGISLQRIRRVLRFLQKELGKGLFEAVENGSEVHLLTDGRNLYLEDDHRNIVDILKNAKQPMISVCVSDHIQRLSIDAGLKKAVKSEKGTVGVAGRVSSSKVS
jgi:DNA-binding transcriptional MerR regulator